MTGVNWKMASSSLDQRGVPGHERRLRAEGAKPAVLEDGVDDGFRLIVAPLCVLSSPPPKSNSVDLLSRVTRMRKSCRS